MSKQKIFTLSYLTKLYNDAKKYEVQRKYIENKLEIDLSQTIEYPNIEEPEGLIQKLNPVKPIESAIALYEAYSNLELIQASDPRFWTYLTHVQLYDYMHKYRSQDIHKIKKGEQSSTESNSIKSKEYFERNGRVYLYEHWFVSPSAKTAGNFSRHDFASMWWIVYLTIDESKGEEHKYDITRVMMTSLSAVSFLLLRRKPFRSKNVFKAVGEFVLENWDDMFKSNFKTKIRYIFDYLSLIGGQTCLFIMKKEDIKNLLINMSPSMMKYANVDELTYTKTSFQYDEKLNRTK